MQQLPKILYYGERGLEEQVFQVYLSRAGYPVQLVSNVDQALALLRLDRSAILVLALDRTLQELMQLTRTILAFTHNPAHAIFVLDGDEAVDAEIPNVDVISRPFRLSKVIRRIQALARKARLNVT